MSAVEKSYFKIIIFLIQGRKGPRKIGKRHRHRKNSNHQQNETDKGKSFKIETFHHFRKISPLEYCQSPNQRILHSKQTRVFGTILFLANPDDYLIFMKTT